MAELMRRRPSRVWTPRGHANDENPDGIDPVNGQRTACYHFATELPGTGADEPIRPMRRVYIIPVILGFLRTWREATGQQIPHFECGAFDHSATSPRCQTGDSSPSSGVF